jgi:hypothetical protein
VLQKTKTIKSGERFRLTRHAMAIVQRDGRNTAILIPEGAIIEVLGGPFDGVRLMDVKYEDELIMMFTNDMETHTVPFKKPIHLKKKPLDVREIPRATSAGVRTRALEKKPN